LLKIINVEHVDKVLMLYIESIFPGEFGHNGYYINNEKISLVSNAIQHNKYAERDFSAVLVNEESYNRVLCLACKRIGEL